MFELLPGRIFRLLSLVFMFVTIVAMLRRSRKGLRTNLRRMPAVDAIEEAVGRAAETGRPMHFSLGRADLTGEYAAQTLAGLDMLAQIARLAAKYDVRLITTVMAHNVLPVAEEVVRQAFLMEGKRPDSRDTRYLSTEQYAYAAMAVGIITRERISANFLMGAFWAESLILAEAGNDVNAIQIGGTGMMLQIPFMVAACDYTLIGEELLVAGIYFAKDEVRSGFIMGQDIFKVVFMGIMIAGAILASFGIKTLDVLLTR